MKNKNMARNTKGKRNGMYKHGLSKTRIHKIWDGMKYRCNCPSNPHYKDWGGRGIKICKEWDDFITFYEWAMANGYDDTLTIERIDNDGDYCPENCKWIKRGDQAKNRRVCIFLTHDGVTKSLVDWANEYGIKYATIYHRYQLGWSVEDILGIPVNYRCKA